MRARMMAGALLVVAASGLVLAGPAPKPKTVIATRLKGQPTVEANQATGYFIWSDAAGIHVRWTSAGGPVLFSGRLDADKPIKDLTRVLAAVGSGWVAPYGDRIIMFSATTRGDVDGFDFSIPGGAKFQADLQIDGAEPQTEQVSFGNKDAHPEGFPLLVLLR